MKSCINFHFLARPQRVSDVVKVNLITASHNIDSKCLTIMIIFTEYQKGILIIDNVFSVSQTKIQPQNSKGKLSASLRHKQVP